MSAFTVNPEFLRNARIQLRPGRAIAAAVICAAVSVTTWYSYMARSAPLTRVDDAFSMLGLVLQLQVWVLLIGGGIYELLSVHREKELNTFDYQRVTRLTSFELAMGKLFGAPVLTYFVTLCLVPIGLAAAVLGEVPMQQLLEAYVIIFVGCIAFHLLALLISMALGRGVSAIAIVPYLIFVGFTSIDYATNNPGYLQRSAPWTLHILNPLAAVEMLWKGTARVSTDLFFGISVSHFVVLLVIYVTFGGLFSLAVVRNLKRDPAVYELYSPVQAFGFAIYFTVLVLGFFNWKAPLGQVIFDQSNPQRFHILGYETLPPQAVLGMVLSNVFWIFAFLGLILLRNREHVRRRVKILGGRAASLWAAFWPVFYSLAGIIMAGVVVVEMIRIYRNPAPDQWSWALGDCGACYPGRRSAAIRGSTTTETSRVPQSCCHNATSGHNAAAGARNAYDPDPAFVLPIRALIQNAGVKIRTKQREKPRQRWRREIWFNDGMRGRPTLGEMTAIKIFSRVRYTTVSRRLTPA